MILAQMKSEKVEMRQQRRQALSENKKDNVPGVGLSTPHQFCPDQEIFPTKQSNSRVKNGSRNQRCSLFENVSINWVTIAGTVSLLAGVSFLSFLETILRRQELECVSKLGSVARCMSPKMYFRENGLFGETSCSFERVETIDCSRGQLAYHTMTIPENPEVYKIMDEVDKS